jgi:hypothetical protein
MKRIFMLLTISSCCNNIALAQSMDFYTINGARNKEQESFLQRKKAIEQLPSGEQRNSQLRQEIQRHQEAMKNYSLQQQTARQQVVSDLRQKWTKVDSDWKGEVARHNAAMKQIEKIPEGPDKVARIAAEDAAHRNTSKRIAVDRQVVHEGVLRQANRDVMGGTANASNSVRQSAGTPVTSASHSGMTSDFDAGGGYRTTEKVGKILNEMGVKAPDGGRVKMTGGVFEAAPDVRRVKMIGGVLETAPEFGMTVNAAPGTDRIGSAGHQAQVKMSAAHGETYISETGGAVKSQVLKDNIATLDHAKKATHGLTAKPEALVGGAADGQAMAKGALKAAAQTNLDAQTVTDIARQNGIKNPEKILDRLAEIKSRQTPIANADEAAKLQGLTRDILNAAEAKANLKAAAEVKQIEGKIADLKAQGQSSQAEQLRKELADYRTKVDAAREVLPGGSAKSGATTTKAAGSSPITAEPKAAASGGLMKVAGIGLGLYGIYHGYNTAVEEMEARKKGEPSGALGWTKEKAELAARTFWHGLGFGAAAEVGEKAGRETYEKYKADIDAGKISAKDWLPYFMMKRQAVLNAMLGAAKAITYDAAKQSGTQLGTAIGEGAGAGKAAYDWLKNTQSEKKTNEERAKIVRDKLLEKGASTLGAQRAADRVLQGDFSEAKRLNRILDGKKAAKLSAAQAAEARAKTLRDRKKREIRKEANKEEQVAREKSTDNELKLRETVIAKLTANGLPRPAALVDRLVRVLERDGVTGLDEAIKEITNMQGTFSGSLGNQGRLIITVTGTKATGTFNNVTNTAGVVATTKLTMNGDVDMISAKIAMTVTGTVTIPPIQLPAAAADEPAWVANMRASASKLQVTNVYGNMNGSFTGNGYKGLQDGAKEWSVQKEK